MRFEVLSKSMKIEIESEEEATKLLKACDSLVIHGFLNRDDSIVSRLEAAALLFMTNMGDQNTRSF